MFYFSEYQSKFFDSTNKKVIGKMKDVYKGKTIGEFTGLISKMNYIRSNGGKKYSTAKGVNILIELNKYKDILFSKK